MNTAASASIARLRSREHALFRLIPKRMIVRMGVVAVVVIIVGAVLGLTVLAAVPLGVMVFALGLVPLRGTSIGELVGSRILFEWTKRVAPIRVRPHPAFGVPLDEGGNYGMRWDGEAILTMLRVEPQSCAITLLSPGLVTTQDVLPLPEVARCLIQSDLGLTSVDVISTGSRTFGTSPVAQLYDRIIGPLPATANRTVWLVLRLDPRTHPNTVRSHGEGATGLLRAAIHATRTMINRLAAGGVAASVLSCAELEEAVMQLTGNIPVEALTDSWRCVAPSPRILTGAVSYLTTYEIDPALLDSQVVTDIWATPSRSTTLTLRLRPVEAGEVAVGAFVRFDTGRRLGTPEIAGLKPLPGRQHRTLLSCLPIGRQPVRLPYAVCYGPPDALAGIALPSGGCGQLIGADSSGRAVALPLVGPTVHRVDIVGGLALAEQVVLRAVAVGAGVVVYTNRPEAWQPIEHNIASPQLLSISAPDEYRTVVVPASASVAVFDGMVPPSRIPTATTVIALSPGENEEGVDTARPTRSMAPRPPADVTLTQHTGSANVITVRTCDGSTIVRMVAIPQELRYVGGYQAPTHHTAEHNSAEFSRTPG